MFSQQIHQSNLLSILIRILTDEGKPPLPYATTTPHTRCGSWWFSGEMLCHRRVAKKRGLLGVLYDWVGLSDVGYHFLLRIDDECWIAHH